MTKSKILFKDCNQQGEGGNNYSYKEHSNNFFKTHKSRGSR